MKRAVSTLILSLASLFFIGWATTSLYNANIQFAKIMKYPEPPWEISMNAIPLFSLLTFGLILTVVYLVIKQKKKNRFHSGFFHFNSLRTMSGRR